MAQHFLGLTPKSGLLAAGALLFGLAHLAPFSPAQNTVFGLLLWMLLWWFTEAVPLAATALLPLVVFGLTGVLDDTLLASSYSNPLIFLFMGGFFLAQGIEKHGLHRRLALSILRRVGSRTEWVLAGVMAATYVLSLWMSNTATAVMMLPLTLSLITHMPGNPEASGSIALERSLLLGMAWGANIGGIGTLIGTPPNLVYAGFRSSVLGVETSFLEWSAVAFPLSLALLVLAYFTLRAGIKGEDLRGVTWPSAEPWSSGERRMLGIFLAVALAWMGQQALEPLLSPWGLKIKDQHIGLLGALALFVVSDRHGQRLLDWTDAQRIEWGILLLFGGGMALASGMMESGWLDALSGLNQFHLPVWAWILFVTALAVWATEFLSNMALVSALLPVVLALSKAQGIPFETLAMPLTVGASCAFMLPMATPPNAVVFASGRLTVPYMAQKGAWLNLWSTLLIAGVFIVLSL
jgi:sodium-dependent dicarboxylate transporter 2/3/5